MAIQLNQPLLTGGLQSIHFANGRLLSAEDLSQDQAAGQQARQYLGQAVGDGVAYGLEVKEATGVSNPQAPVVSISAGLALNRLGQTLRLPENTNVALVAPAPTGAALAAASQFDVCQPLQGGPYVAGAGVYLLTILPATGTQGKAPVSGLGGLDARCNAQYDVFGAQFRLLPLPVTAAELSNSGPLRNHLAYRCFGAADPGVIAFPANPFGPVVTQHGLLDNLRPDCLNDNEVPLALINLTVADGLKFIDGWAVRRRVTRPAADGNWPLWTADRRLAEAEAMFLQFQQQVQDLRIHELNLELITALARFEYLPPVGLLPVAGVGRSRGFSLATFFTNLPYRQPRYVEGAQLNHMLQASLQYPPLALRDREAINVYWVRDNRQAIDANPDNQPQAYVIFTTGHGPDWSRARYDLAHWDYANYQ